MLAISLPTDNDIFALRGEFLIDTSTNAEKGCTCGTGIVLRVQHLYCSSLDFVAVPVYSVSHGVPICTVCTKVCKDVSEVCVKFLCLLLKSKVMTEYDLLTMFVELML